MSNKYKRWTIEDNKYLIEHIELNENIKDISSKLERSEYGIIRQLEKLLLNNNIDSQKLYQDLLIDLIKKHNLNLLLNTNKENTNKENTNKENINLDINTQVEYLLNDVINTVEDIAYLNDEQILCYNLAKSRKNIFITGPGGCGKTFILKSIIKYFKRNKFNIGITSSTGCSASLINGTTLHSFLNIGLANKSATELYERLKSKINKTTYKKLKNLDVLIIDEISMIDDKLFNKIAAYLSLIKEIKKPFGKIQIILSGDFYQLAPINNDYCFKSNIWNMLKIKTIELKQMMRQNNDLEFQNLLYNVKINNITDDIYNTLLNLKKNKFNNDILPTILCSKNEDINKINNNNFNKLVNNTNSRIYTYAIRFDETNNKISKYLKNNNLLNNNLQLVVGTQVMLTYNINIKNNLVNGTRGIITKLNTNNIIIKILNGNEFIIDYVKYINDIDETITFEYMPIKVAYAISIHKSQGMTLDYILIDLGDSIFSNGMAYVALSRAKSLKSIVISNLSKKSFRINTDVIKFYKTI
jgi:ATP-dependent DNA helicase PIF1